MNINKPYFDIFLFSMGSNDPKYFAFARCYLIIQAIQLYARNGSVQQNLSLYTFSTLIFFYFESFLNQNVYVYIYIYTYMYMSLKVKVDIRF